MALPLVESPAPPSEVQTLLREFADVFPLKLPPGLPVERVTDYRIVLLPDYKPFANWLYKMFSGGRQGAKRSAGPVLG